MRNNYCFFSIIVVFHNEADSLLDTLTCVTNQDYPKSNFELICIDDASTDKSYSIARKFTKKIKRFDKNVGISMARNEAVKKSNGEILLFLDGHMSFKKTFLSKLNKLYNNYPNVSGICGSYETRSETNWDKIRDIRRKSVFRKNKKKLLITMDNFTTFSSAVGSLIKKDVLKAGGYPSGFQDSAGEDTLLQIKLHNLGHKFLYTPSINAYHEAKLDKKELFYKMISEIKSTGNMLIMGGKESLNLPYLNFFLDYPLSLMISLVLLLLFKDRLFVFLIIMALVNMGIRILPTIILNNYSLTDRLCTVGYLLIGELIKALYLPFYLFSKKAHHVNLVYLAKRMLNWEIKKWSSLPSIIFAYF